MSELRPPTHDDVVAAARLIAEHWPEPVDEDRIRREWTAPGVVLELDARIGPGVYALVQDMGRGRAWIETHGPAAPEALDWAESRARELGATRAFSGAWSENGESLRALGERGYGLVRRSQRMEIDLSSPPESPHWPEGISVRSFADGDERRFYELQEEAFRDMWEPMEETYEEWAHWHLAPARLHPELWFVAESGSEGCGVAICHPHETLGELGWVGILAVRRDWRRRGIGRALLLHAFERFRDRGLVRAGLGVDSDSVTGAHTLYESVGMRVTQQFDIYEKALG